MRLLLTEPPTRHQALSSCLNPLAAARVPLEMKRHGEPWTYDDLANLKTLLADGRTMREVARLLGRTEEATRVQATKAGLTGRHRT